MRFLYQLKSALFLTALTALFVCASNSMAETATQDSADETALAENPQWLALLHMRRSATGHWHSEVDAASFFLSGRDDDAVAELHATRAALQEGSSGSFNAWCRFPARAAFLSAHFDLPKPNDLQCAALDNWRKQFTHDELVLVYPEPYMKNVASIFGHTFLRFDAADKKANPVLLSKTLSYYADVAAAGNTLTYIVKGLGGGFDGIIEIATYFQKLRKYSDNEDRDIREYRLALTPAQIQTFIDHAWEVRGHSFHYFFLTENCSYRLIAMLDVVTPTHRIREAFNWDAMPVDTVAALRDNQLIFSETYIPSAKKKFYEQLATLSPAQHAQLLAVVRGDVRDDDVEDLQVLALTTQYSNMQMHTDSQRSASHEVQVARLIRRQYETGQVLPETPTHLQALDPTVAGHRQTRLQIGARHNEDGNFMLLGARAAYHAFHDPQGAYQKGVQLEVLDTLLRVNTEEQDSALQLEQLHWFSLNSYNVRDDFFQPASWGFDLSRTRELIDEKTSLLNTVNGYRGIAFDCGAWICHGEMIGSALGGNTLDLGWSARAGARAGLLYQSSQWTSAINFSEQKYLAGEHNTLSSIEAEVGYPLARNTSLYGSYRHDNNGSTNHDSVTFSLRQFF